MENKDKLVFYIHQFGSNGIDDTNAESLKKSLDPKCKFYNPTIVVNPDLAIDNLIQELNQLTKFYDVKLVGHGLGGYYALFGALKYNLHATLLNPILNPQEHQKQFKGMRTNTDQSQYEYTDKQIDCFNNHLITKISKEQAQKIEITLSNDHKIEGQNMVDLTKECRITLQQQKYDVADEQYIDE